MFPVVIPVAGLGTRSLPASKVIPKEMLPIYDRPLIQVVVEEMAASGVEQVVFVSSQGKEAIENHFDIQRELERALEGKPDKETFLEEVRKVSRLVTVRTVRQKEPLGLGHAVWMAKSSISESHFFVALSDELVAGAKPGAAQLMEAYKTVQTKNPDAGVIMLMEVPEQDVSKYGICEVDSSSSDMRITRCIEKPKPSETTSRLSITGRYLLPRKLMDYLSDQAAGALGEIQLTDALHRLAEEGLLYGCMLQGERIDAGDRMGFLKANIHYYLQSEYAEQTKQLLGEMAK